MLRKRSALFESWRGQYNDGPRALSESLGARRPETRRLWASTMAAAFPADVDPVKRHSPRYFKELATADLLVSNDLITRYPVKSARTTYVQMWHGTPLKLIGHDEHRLTYSGARDQRRRMEKDVARWDYLVSQSPTCTSMLRSAFAWDGPVWETGYPRNDALKSPTAPTMRARTRHALGIDPSTTMVLHVPTWRDDHRLPGGGFASTGLVDLDRLADRCDSPVALVSRTHKNIALPLTRARSIDGNDVAEVTNLYLAADVLVSDYSSAIYDFAVTRKPIVLFAPDLDQYRDVTRGFYFDYEAWAPGPIATTIDDVASHVDDLGKVAKDWSGRYEEFAQEFCPWDDGHAAERLCDLLFSVTDL